MLNLVDNAEVRRHLAEHGELRIFEYSSTGRGISESNKGGKRTPEYEVVLNAEGLVIRKNHGVSQDDYKFPSQGGHLRDWAEALPYGATFSTESEPFLPVPAKFYARVEKDIRKRAGI